jgi:hypothetical protein
MFKKAMVLTMGLVISGFFMVALSAAPKKKACNDLKIDQCKDRKDCEWIKAHKTKDGKEVKAFCKCKGKCK